MGSIEREVFMIGRNVSRYRILQSLPPLAGPIGGGMGLFCIAEDNTLKRNAAPKSLYLESAADIDVGQYVMREVQDAISPDDPDICGIRSLRRAGSYREGE
jgi:hypothetical protein